MVFIVKRLLVPEDGFVAFKLFVVVVSHSVSLVSGGGTINTFILFFIVPMLVRLYCNLFYWTISNNLKKKMYFFYRHCIALSFYWTIFPFFFFALLLFQLLFYTHTIRLDTHVAVTCFLLLFVGIVFLLLSLSFSFHSFHGLPLVRRDCWTVCYKLKNSCIFHI